MVNKALHGNSFALDGQVVHAPALEPGLYVVATPIGHLGDITLRALQTLARADLIACEDTRTSRTLLKHFAIEARLTAYHDHNGPKARPIILAALEAGQSVALISDAGTPLIADPGFKLVAAALDAGHRVVAIPGPSALTASLSIAGQPTDRFTFAGFLPSKKSARQTQIEALAGLQGSLCLYETAQRLADSLDDLAAGLGPERPASVCREITKRYETVRRGTLAELAAHYRGADDARGEIVIVIGPPVEKAAAAATLDEALRAALQTERIKDAAALVAEAYGVPRRQVYQRALDLVRETPNRAPDDPE